MDFQPKNQAVKSWQRLAFSLFVLAYFLYFTRDGIFVHFAPDDLMNMAGTWRMKPISLLLAQFSLWYGYYRPLSGLFHVPLVNFFGLNPVPFHAGMILILLANVYLMYRFARLLGCTELIAGLAALVVAYHPGLQNLYYNTAFIYDVLCFSFYIGALIYYFRIRTSGRLLRIRENAAFLLLYLCALNAKEMALTLPFVLLAYELIFHGRPRGKWRALLVWLNGPGFAVLLTGVMNLVYLYGKAFGPDALMNASVYQPVISLERLVNFQTGALSDLLCVWNYFEWAGILAAWLVVTYLAWRRPRPVLRFCWIYMVVTPLPIMFLLNRVHACLYIPLAGWAVFAAVVLLDLARPIADFLSREPIFRHFGRRICLAVVVAVCICMWVLHTDYLKQKFIKPQMAELGQQTWEVIQQFRELNPRVQPHSRVVFLSDPFLEWDMKFIAELWFRDRSVSVHIQRREKAPPQEIAKADYLFAYQDGKFIQLKGGGI
jgi:hypothetical protein